MRFQLRIEQNIIIAESMAEGLSLSKIAVLVGINPQTLKNNCNDIFNGYTFKRKKAENKKPYVKGSNVDTSRDDDMCARYKSGETLKSIGKSYGISRERVRQIIKRYGLTGESGGARFASFKKTCEKRRIKAEIREERLMNTYGVTNEQWSMLRGLNADLNKTPLRYWHSQKRSARDRGIEWSLTLWDWWTVWSESGRYKQRGLGMGKYVMARIADTGGYSVDNIEIIKHEQNSKDYYDIHYDEWYEKRNLMRLNNGK